MNVSWLRRAFPVGHFVVSVLFILSAAALIALAGMQLWSGIHLWAGNALAERLNAVLDSSFSLALGQAGSWILGAVALLAALVKRARRR